MSLPTHVAIIMDGNGRWAAQRGWARNRGHREGVKAAVELLDGAADLGIRHVTLFAFSTENWKRPRAEVMAIMALFRHYLKTFLPRLKAKGIRFHHLGTMEGLPNSIQQGIHNLEAETRDHDGMVLHLAVNYGSRLELVQAARRCVEDGLLPEEVTEAALANRLWTAGVPDVDLLIRTSGEMRLSNFLLWQCAYSEFLVTDCLWPDFRLPQLQQALDEYAHRERRFGGL
jgi:undecaprenyl diphosphate synthase